MKLVMAIIKPFKLDDVREALEDQDMAVTLIEGTGDADAIDFARQHHAMIQRFGRFPHRNAALGRETLPEEAEAVAEGSDW